MNLFEGTLQLDLFLNQFEHKSKYPLRSGRGDVWIRIWKCRLEEMMREDLNEATMQGDNADKVAVTRLNFKVLVQLVWYITFWNFFDCNIRYCVRPEPMLTTTLEI